MSLYGPVSLLLLVSLWACALIVGFGLLFRACGEAVRTVQGNVGFTTCLYLSGTTFLTLGLGDVIPATSWMRSLTLLEAGMGFGFLAIIISYLPGFSQSFRGGRQTSPCWMPGPALRNLQKPEWFVAYAPPL